MECYYQRLFTDPARMTGHTFFATTPRGMEPLLMAELSEFGARQVSPGSAGVSFTGDLPVAYRACLWSRVANRILLSLGEFPAPDEQSLYNSVGTLDWSRHLTSSSTLAVNVHSAKSNISHTHFAAQRVKDAIVDQFRGIDGSRPSVDRDRPDVRINAYLFRNRLRLSLDLSGGSLHRREYRRSDGAAPLKENLAAAILLFAGWPEIAARGGNLIDPMCGSGTLLIEAAMIAGDVAPGLNRTHYGFTGWGQHDAQVWRTLREQAECRRRAGLTSIPAIYGFDIDGKALGSAADNATAAGLRQHICVEKRDVASLQFDSSIEHGLLVVNPPYGKRMDADSGLAKLYSTLGKAIRRHHGWRAAVFTGNPKLTHRFRLTPSDSKNLNNGELACKLQLYRVSENGAPTAPEINASPADDGSVMFANRLTKNCKTLGSWAKSTGVDCYRVYDADLPEYAVAIDLYPGTDAILRVHVREYAAPQTVDAERARHRLQQVMDAIPSLLDCDARQVYLKVSARQRGAGQYRKIARREEFHEVLEAGCRLLVNLADYHDCGLFLDHRKVRRKMGKLARGKRVLNLFAYTGAASVHAALGGASHVTTVDMSTTYLDWARKNFAINGLSSDDFEFVREDCVQWLSQPYSGKKYDLILLDPPTFSNSKRMSSSWDVQRDHTDIIEKTMRRLSDNGLLLFSTNRQRFKLDSNIEKKFSCRDISRQTVPRDFTRNAGIHRCWEIRLPG